MDTAEEEWFVFLNFAQADLGLARRALTHASAEYPPFVQYCVLRDAIVTYARPFKKSQGKFTAALRLPNDYVPEAHLPLHEQMLQYRDKAYAHTDLDARNPQLHCWTRTNPPILFIQLSPVDREPLHFKTAALSALFAAVSSRVDAEVLMLQKKLHAIVKRENLETE